MKNHARVYVLLLLFSCFFIRCGGDDSTDGSKRSSETDIVVSQKCLDNLPPLKEDCLISKGEQLHMESQAEVDLICNSPCTAAQGITIDDRSNQEALKVLRRLTYVENANLHFHENIMPDMSIFSGLERAGNLTIQSERKEFSLHGLENLKTVDYGLRIHSKGLKNMEGLNNLESVGITSLYDQGKLDISSNYALESLSGLDSLEQIGSLYVVGNPKLKNIEALSSLKRVNDGIVFGSNRQMSSLKGLDMLGSMAGSFHFTKNPALPQCQATALLERLGGKDVLGERASVRIQENLVTPECF